MGPLLPALRGKDCPPRPHVTARWLQEGEASPSALPKEGSRPEQGLGLCFHASLVPAEWPVMGGDSRQVWGGSDWGWPASSGAGGSQQGGGFPAHPPGSDCIAN